eukprot:328057-Amphidinium_carterae.1
MARPGQRFASHHVTSTSCSSHGVFESLEAGIVQGPSEQVSNGCKLSLKAKPAGVFCHIRSTKVAE